MADFYDFNERLQFSEGVGLTDEVLRHIVEHTPASKGWRKAEVEDDRNGTDYWIDRKHNLPPVSIDIKAREFCPIQRFNSDDACIETTSIYKGPRNAPWTDNHRDRPGWTIDETKRTDLIVYTWPHDADLFGAPRTRYWILYFPFLCAASMRNWREWAEKYGERAAPNRTYITLSVYPPRNVIAQAIKKFTSGVITAPTPGMTTEEWLSDYDKGLH